MKTFLLTLSAVAALAVMPLQPAMAQSNDTLVVGVDVDAGTLDPRLARDTTAYRANDLIYSGLVHLTPNLEAVPDLAESWESPDPKTFIFKLRDGLTFSDGSSLTADDVVFTYQTMTDPDFNSPIRSLYSPISMIEKMDDRTVKFTLSEPYAPLLSYLDIGIVPKKLVEGGRDIGAEPIGAGPMKFVEWKRGSEIVLEANPGFWGGAPEMKQVTLKLIPDNSARAQAFEAGDLNVIQSPLSPQDINRLAADDRFGNVIIPGLAVTYLNFNANDPLLSDPKMRQAFAMLVDQETIVNDIYQGADAIANAAILPSSWAYSEDIKQPAFDIEGAKAKFAELGWTDSNGDGILDKDGAPLEVTIATHSEDPNRIQAVEYIQAIFAQAGVNAKTQLSDWPSFSTGYVLKGEHQIALLGWVNIVDPDRLLFSQLTTGGGRNWGGYSNPKVDELLQAGRSSLNTADRTAAYRAAATTIAEEVPYYIISYQGYQMFYDKDLPVSVEATPRGNLRGLIGLKND